MVHNANNPAPPFLFYHLVAMHYLTLYSFLQNKALRSITDLTRHDLIVLQVLSIIDRPTVSTALHAVIADVYGTISYTTYYGSMEQLSVKGYITRVCIGKRIVYELTVYGKRIVEGYNRTLERLAKEYNDKYNIPAQWY